MSTGHLRYERKSDADLYKMLGEGDTPELYARKVKIDTTYDWPYAGGNSVDGRTVYIDCTLYRELMDGVVKVRGLSPRDILQAWIEHEHTEFAVDSGDNPVDTYPAAHEFANAKEHRFVRLLGVNPERYEEAIMPALKRCVRRFIKLDRKANPPRDVWCGPILDDPDKDDIELIRILRAKGVTDAFKKSKVEVHYGIGESECKDCTMFGTDEDRTGKIRQCQEVSGLVRANRHCKLWTPKDPHDGR